MKKQILRGLATMLFLMAFVVSCNHEDQNVKPDSRVLEEKSEIARFEKEEGITFFKKNVVFESGGNQAILTIATRDETIFNNVVENFEVVIKPIYKNDEHVSEQDGQNSKEDPQQIAGEEILTEFIKMVRENGVIGFSTKFRLKSASSPINGKTALSGYSAYVTHYSNNWPSQFWLDLPNSGAGVRFECKRKWYNGWESDTNCTIGSTCGFNVGVCAVEHNIFGACYYVWDVDGPYKSRTQVGYFIPGSDGWTWGYTY